MRSICFSVLTKVQGAHFSDYSERFPLFFFGAVRLFPIIISAVVTGPASFCSASVLVIRVPTEKDSDVLFGDEYKHEIQISQAADDSSFFVR